MLSVEVSRQAWEAIDSVVADVARQLRGALTLDDRNSFRLLACGRLVRPHNKIGEYYADRDKLWGALEKSGPPTPHGVRAEVKIDYGGKLCRFVGYLEVEPEGIPMALEISRVENAVLVGLASTSAQEFAWDAIVSRLGSAGEGDSPSLLALALTVCEGSGVLIRAFGQFDDSWVGVDVFADDDVLDSIELALSHHS